MKRKTAWGRLLIVGTLLSFVAIQMASAVAPTLSRAYKATERLSQGTIVSVKNSDTQSVVASNSTATDQQFVGVIINGNDSLLAIDLSNDTVQVATSGTIRTLVSTLAGSIKSGDKIAASPFSGIGMNAGSSVPIVGTAQGDFNDKTSGAKLQTVLNKSGKSQQVHVGYVDVTIGIGISDATEENLNSLQQLAKSITGRSIPTIRIIISILIAIIAIIALGMLIYASIYGSIIGIGRNPLAKGVILHSLTRVLVLAGMLAIISITVIILLLR